MRTTAFFGWLLLTSLLIADPTLPEKVELQPGRLGWVAVQTASTETIHWVNPNPALDLIPVENGRKAILSSPKAGVYRVFAYTTLGAKATPPVETVIVVGKAPEPGPEPGPGPEPTPTPDDPLYKPLQAAYGKDTGDKVAGKAKLVRLYRAAASTNLEKYETAGELFTALKDMGSSVGLAAGEVIETRKAIGKELSEVLPAEAESSLTQDHRANAISIFKRLVPVLEALK